MRATGQDNAQIKDRHHGNTWGEKTGAPPHHKDDIGQEKMNPSPQLSSTWKSFKEGLRGSLIQRTVSLCFGFAAGYYFGTKEESSKAEQIHIGANLQTATSSGQRPEDSLVAVLQRGRTEAKTKSRSSNLPRAKIAQPDSRHNASFESIRTISDDGQLTWAICEVSGIDKNTKELLQLEIDRSFADYQEAASGTINQIEEVALKSDETSGLIIEAFPNKAAAIIADLEDNISNLVTRHQASVINKAIRPEQTFGWAGQYDTRITLIPESRSGDARVRIQFLLPGTSSIFKEGTTKVTSAPFWLRGIALRLTTKDL